MSTWRLSRLGGSASAVATPPTPTVTLTVDPATVEGLSGSTTWRLSRLGGKADSSGVHPPTPTLTLTVDPPTVAGGSAQSTWRLSRLGGNAHPHAGATWRLSRLGGSAVLNAVGNAVWRLSRLGGKAVPHITAAATAPATAEPFDTVTVDASATTGAVSYLLTQTAGTPVTVVGSGPTWTYEAPATREGDTVAFTVTAHSTAGDSTATVSTAVYPVAEYDLVGPQGSAVWVPRRTALIGLISTQRGSGVPMPVGNIPGWTQIYSEDFDVDMPIGAFVPKASGSDAGTLNTGGAADARYGSKITVYPEGWAASSTGTSRPVEVLDVANSCLRMNFANHPTLGVMAATVHPLIGPTYSIDPAVTTSVRIDFRFRVDQHANLAGWGGVIQLIANNTDWSAYHGELDVIEGNFNQNAETNWHPQSATNTTDPWGARPYDDLWHTGTIIWTPTLESFALDGVLIGSTTTQVSTHPRSFLLQSGGNSTPPAAPAGSPDPAVRGQWLFDWVVAYTAG